MHYATKTKITSSLLSIFCCLYYISFPNIAHAKVDVHYSKYRFVFDDKHRKDSLTIRNTGNSNVSCSISLAHFIMNELGPQKIAKNATEVPNSAKNLIRFSPRKVNITAGQNQTVRISSRRKPNIEDKEYLSYLKLSCQEIELNNKEQVGQVVIKPKFIHYMPIQIRVGNLSASMSFENIKVIEKQGMTMISFDQIKTGNRSLVGTIKIKERDSDRVLGQINNSVIYADFNKKHHKINILKNKGSKVQLEIVFTEDKNTWGSVTAQANII
ncbi:hypothetical protein [Colwellia sp. TT2012]|uniref:hypothetical protein n=1 Tax=Colwellia sp. TT2012 TaxID=1720342 RepID=UPI000A83F093|nr:hypothetical protein [Colwellia sp. TT2012]